MYYKCHDCNEYFDEDDMDEKEICLEDYYGVGRMFQSHNYQRVGCCPHCHSEEIEEVSDYELVGEIEDLRYEVQQLKKRIKELKNGK